MENLNPANSDDIRRTALILADRYRIVSERPKDLPKKKPSPAATGPAIVNAPLDFTLKGLDPDHPYLKARGFTRQTVDHFELGYASRGLMQGRIAIPLKDDQSRLIGYAGRVVDDLLITVDNPKYRLPTARDHDGRRYEFSHSRFLYNGSAVQGPVDELIVVRSYPSVWWLWQHGYTNTVAVMGSACSPEQAELVVGKVPRRGRVLVFMDGNKVGGYCAVEVLRHLAPYRFCRWVQLKDERKPTNCDADELRRLLS